MRGIIVRVDGTSEDFDVPLFTSGEENYTGASADRDAIGAAIKAAGLSTC